MAAIYQHSDTGNGVSGRKNITAVISKAAELRALHAALMQRKTPGDRSLSSASPVSRRLSAQDYPVFTPSYEDEPPLTSHHQILSKNLNNHSKSWGSYAFDVGNANASSHQLMKLEGHLCPSQNQDSCPNNNISVLKPSRTNSLGDVSIIVPSTDSHSSLHSQSRNNKGMSLSSLFPRLKTKNKHKEMLSVVILKKELIEAHKSLNSALIKAEETKSALGELTRKLEYLETHCEELKKALQETVFNIKNYQLPVDGLSEEVMMKAFLQIVSESRLSVKQFCKTIIMQIGEKEKDNLNSLLQPYNISLTSKNSKPILNHLVAIVNQSLYQDFENCVFRKNGAPNTLDPHQECKSRYKLFIALKNLSWEEVLRKGTKYYSEEFSKLCDHKMSGIVESLGWSKPWPENLLQAFFVAAKCVWLLHLIAFSFDPFLWILRVDENRDFEARFMEDVFGEKEREKGCLRRVKVMVMPGFYVHDQVLKCKVLCRYKSSA